MGQIEWQYWLKTIYDEQLMWQGLMILKARVHLGESSKSKEEDWFRCKETDAANQRRKSAS